MSTRTLCNKFMDVIIMGLKKYISALIILIFIMGILSSCVKPNKNDNITPSENQDYEQEIVSLNSLDESEIETIKTYAKIFIEQVGGFTSPSKIHNNQKLLFAMSMVYYQDIVVNKRDYIFENGKYHLDVDNVNNKVEILFRESYSDLIYQSLYFDDRTYSYLYTPAEKYNNFNVNIENIENLGNSIFTFSGVYTLSGSDTQRVGSFEYNFEVVEFDVLDIVPISGFENFEDGYSTDTLRYESKENSDINILDNPESSRDINIVEDENVEEQIIESSVSSVSPQENSVENVESSSASPTSNIFKLVIPEGYTLAKIGMILEKNQICTAQEFISASKNIDISGFSLLANQSNDPNRCFNLEGYLFPDTYEIYRQDTPEQIITKILTNTEKKMTSEIRERITQSGYSIDQIIIVASIIEKEALGRQHMNEISSVIYNRINSGMKLQMDVTISYVEGAIKPFIDGDVNRYNNFYNTYKCGALPSGAICNPGMDSIEAALAPANTDYFYFVTDINQQFYFSNSFEQHEAVIAEIEMG